MPVYRPRMMAILEAPIEGAGANGEVIKFPIRVRSATWTSNDFRHADELDLEATWSDAGIDPRFIRDANIAFYLDDARDGEFVPAPKNLRFVGLVRSIERKMSEGGSSVGIKAQDFTSLFLDCKKLSAQYIPHFTDTLPAAWARICEGTGVLNLTTGELVSTVAKLANRLEFRGVDPSLTIGSGVSSRIAKLGGVVPSNNADSWAVWLQAVGDLGLVSWIEFDKCIVATTTDLYEDNPKGVPLIVYGKNILEVSEVARGSFSAKGVGIQSFNPQTGKCIEAVYPDPSDPRIHRKKRVAAKKKNGATQAIADSTNYEWFSYPGNFTEEQVLARAKLAWEERSRQELEGHFSTAEMRVENASSQEFDVLELRAGDSIRVEIDTSIDRGVFSAMSLNQRVDYLVERGYEAGVATLLAKNAKEFLRRGLTFKTHEVRTHLDTSEDAGTFSVDVRYLNRIVIEDTHPA